MDIDSLFLKTIEDIEERLESKDWYEILMISGLLRKLLIDSNPLVHQVNRSRKNKIRYKINNKKPSIIEGLRFWSIEDGLDPETSVSPTKNIKSVKIDELLSSTVIIKDGEEISVKNLIKFLSNVQGGVHVGKPKKDKEFIIKKVQEQIGIGGLPAGLRLTKVISRVVIKGLEPLINNIKKNKSI